MTTPATTSPFERLQSTYIRLHNNRVNILFRDVRDDQLDSPRGLLKTDLIMTDNDTALLMQLKTGLLNDYIDVDRNIYALPIEDYHRKVAFQPQVCLIFVEKQSTANSFKRRRVEMRVSFRIVDKTRTTITQTYIDELEREIKGNFPKTYGYEKGKLCFSYRDKDNGYEFKMIAKGEPEVKELIAKVLKIKDDIPNYDYLTKSEYTDKNLITPKFETILGKRTKLPIQRPTATVYLKKAELKIGGVLEDIILLDRYI